MESTPREEEAPVTSPLTPDILTYDFKSAGDPQLSPDGARLIYTLGQVERGKTRGTSQIWLCDRDGGNARQLTGDEPVPADYNFPQWSPDGKTIAAQRPNHNGMQSQLALIDVVTGQQTRVGPEAGVVAVWSWSPGGDRIIYSGDTHQTYQTDF